MPPMVLVASTQTDPGQHCSLWTHGLEENQNQNQPETPLRFFRLTSPSRPSTRVTLKKTPTMKATLPKRKAAKTRKMAQSRAFTSEHV
ncbi:hypothetical protein TYRP_009567 [Tyrophagus putrescentiae]|nr:hypothetical protein TYRP_009567 [Tyrophagus putrescentiae]